MDPVLETLISVEKGRARCNPKARTALNILTARKYGEEYRLLMYSSLLDRTISSSKDLTYPEVYGLLKYMETQQHDRSKPI